MFYLFIIKFGKIFSLSFIKVCYFCTFLSCFIVIITYNVLICGLNYKINEMQTRWCSFTDFSGYFYFTCSFIIMLKHSWFISIFDIKKKVYLPYGWLQTGTVMYVSMFDVHNISLVMISCIVNNSEAISVDNVNEVYWVDQGIRRFSIAFLFEFMVILCS